MLDALWAFLRDLANRDAIGWVGAGITAVAVALWAVVRFVVPGGEDKSEAEVKVDRGGVSIGGSAIKRP